MIWVTIITAIVVFLLWLSFNPYARKVRKIQSLLNKDRTVCDVINMLDGWSINSTDKQGLRILIDPVVMPIYPLYITCHNHMPTDKELGYLYKILTDEDYIVVKAHEMDMPVENYMKMKKYMEL